MGIAVVFATIGYREALPPPTFPFVVLRVGRTARGGGTRVGLAVRDVSQFGWDESVSVADVPVKPLHISHYWVSSTRG